MKPLKPIAVFLLYMLVFTGTALLVHLNFIEHEYLILLTAPLFFIGAYYPRRVYTAILVICTPASIYLILNAQTHLVPSLRTTFAVLATIVVSSEIIHRLLQQRQEMVNSLQFTLVALENASIGVLELDADGVIHYVNRRFCRITGYTRDELTGMKIFRLLPEETDAAWQEHWNEMKIRTSWHGELTLARKNGGMLPTEVSGRYLQVRDREYICYFVTDITERREAEEALRKSEGLYRSIMNNIDLGVTFMDRNQKIIMMNTAAGRISLLNPSESIGHYCYKVFENRDRTCPDCPGQKAMRIGRPVESEESFSLPGGQIRTLHVKTFPVFDSEHKVTGYVEIQEDITEKKRQEEEQQHLEQRLQQARRQESLSILAGGIAHDFNNLLMEIMGNADLALHHLPEESGIKHNINSIESAATRAADLCRQMLAFSGRCEYTIENLNLSEIVRQTAEEIRDSLPENCSLIFHLEEGLPPVRADGNQLKQIVMHLITNAADAISGEGGDIHVCTGREECRREYLDTFHLGNELPEGAYLFLDVSDTGCGMDAELQERIFEPFFSTRFARRGMGMPAVMGIIRGHQGAIRIQSGPEKGASFRVLFPEKPA